jgi:hypothetical protein
LTTCPCCGSKFEGEMRDGCAGCGACPVGPPLARPERELPGYGPAFFVGATGALSFLSFLVALCAALFERETFTLDTGALARAAETAAWRLKLSALPATIAAAFVSLKLYARMRREPSRFVGMKAARAGLALTALTAVALASLVGVTVPERLRRRELARRAAENALLYAGDQALARYRARFGTYPATLGDLRRLDDPNCELAASLEALGATEYKAETDLASLSTAGSKGGGKRRSARTRNVSARNTDDLPGAGLALTNYELTLPGRDKVLGTEDDLRIHDGRIVEPGSRPAAGTRQHAPAAAGRRAH